MLDKDVARKLVHGRPWHHDFEIVPGVRTHGAYNPESLWHALKLPADMTGMSLADIGASNGYFSFEARKRGARVVAFDTRHKDNSGFGLLQYINGMSDIEHHQVNIMEIDPNQYGRFDIVLAMGLLYHTPDPYRALVRSAALARERLVIESYCIDRRLPRRVASEPLVRFISDPQRFPGLGQPNADRSNFWGFTAMCLQRMLEDLGFAVRRRQLLGDRVLIDAWRTGIDQKDTRLSTGYGVRQHVAVGENPDDPGSWTVF